MHIQRAYLTTESSSIIGPHRHVAETMYNASAPAEAEGPKPKAEALRYVETAASIRGRKERAQVDHSGNTPFRATHATVV